MLNKVNTQKLSTIEKKLGISYEEFEQLDFNEQQKLIKHIKKKRKGKPNRTIMIGTGEHATFVQTGITPEKSLQDLEKKMNAIIRNATKEKTKQKILSLIKRK